MYPWVVGTAGYALLMSSFINFLIFVRKALKLYVTSSFYALSISDILTSILIGVLLILNHSEMSMKSYVRSNINTSTTAGNIWNYKSMYEKEYKVALSMYEKLNNSNNTYELEENQQCENVASILMHYAMLLVPFSNAFVSLLTFSMQCNLNAVSMNARCTDLVKCKQSNENKQKNNGNKENTTCSTNDEFCDASTSRQFEQATEGEIDLHNRISIREKSSHVTATLKNVMSNGLKERNMKSIMLYIMMQWLVPVIVTGALYFAEYRNVNVMAKTENMRCIFEVNFPFNNCYMYTENNDSVIMSIINDGKVPAKDDYTASENLLKILDPNNTKVNQVVSEIQKIVQSELHKVHNTSDKVQLSTLYNISQPANENNYIEIINFTNTTKDNNNTETVGLHPVEEVSIQMNSTSFNLPNIYIQHNAMPATETISTEKGLEVALFEELMKKASQQINSNLYEKESFQHSMDTNISQESNSTNYDIEVETTAVALSAEEIKITETTQSSHKPSMSNDQIYADIMKRIESASTHTGLGDKNKGIYHEYTKKRPKQSNLEYQHLPSQLPFITQLFLESTKTLSANINEEIVCVKQMHDKCFVSPKFVKLHLLVLMFTIYFLPILFSAILQERGKLVCQNILDKLESKVITTSAMSSLFEVENVNNDLNKTDKTRIFWYPRNENVTYDMKQNISNVETQTIKNITRNESNGELDQNKQTYMCVLNGAKSIQEHFRSIKMSLLLATILWTPMFLELLLKVFLCTRIPKWVTSTTFVSAISFNILRNLFNIKTIQMCDNNTSGNRKENTVHPTV